ncbi:uncharacterized protein METZ01_LOCUS196716 [marine metagenome]|uniref:Uncharacterized protein n=1 Tax=marine metagenome TaxID=408172 RepID=A0A382E0F9_9ZZZZ
MSAWIVLELLKLPVELEPTPKT